MPCGIKYALGPVGGGCNKPMKRMRIVCASLIVLIAAGCANATPASPAQTAPVIAPVATSTIVPLPTRPGNKVDVGGYDLYLYCTGAGSPTVILESGLGGDNISWNQVQPGVAKFARVCSYDRAGLANSDYGPVPRNAKLAAADLHTLLANANIAPPYILVGHSFGGLLIRRYAFDYPEEVTGLIFVDSLHENWWEEALTLLPPASSNDSARLASFRGYLTDGWRTPSGNFEAMDIPAVVEQVRETGNFGTTPISVLTAGVFDVLNPGLPRELEQALAALFAEQQSRLAALSTDGTQIVIPESGHDMPREQPQAVVDAIREMITNP